MRAFLPRSNSPCALECLILSALSTRSDGPLLRPVGLRGCDGGDNVRKNWVEVSLPSFPRFLLKLVPACEDLPILLAMTELPLADARNRLSELVADVEQTQERVMITKHGHPAAVLISPDDLASLEETLDVLSDPDALADIREAEAEAGRGEYTSAAQMQLLLEERRRRSSGAA